MNKFRLFLLALASFALVKSPCSLLASDSDVEFSVTGGGFWRNRAIKAQLTTLFAEDKNHLEASDIEDAALIALSSLQAEGYLNARTNAEISILGGEIVKGEWDKSFSFFLPRDLKADSVEFELILGPRFFFESLEIGGDHSLEREEIESFFFAEGFLLENKKDRVFTESGLKAGVGNLEGYLRQLGFLDAKASGRVTRRNEENGSVEAFVTVEQGDAHVVDSIVIESDQIDQLIAIDAGSYKGQTFSRFVMQDIGKALRNRYYEAGYPDASVKSSYKVSGKRGDEVLVTVKVLVEPGEGRTVGSIGFSGHAETRQRLMHRQLKLAEGDPLNPVALEESRVELSRLGVFRKVDYELLDSGEGVSDLKFLLEERYPWTVDMIFGWGSYENLRGGVIAERKNLFGKAHRARFKGFASMKSLLADARYLVPDLWNSDTALTSKLFILNREEASFEREEFGFD
ncbi:MAG: POTRA domain-containing protein, partial [Verrucomicrobiota bacterium]